MHTIDATGKKIGRIASEAASFLLGKHAPTFVKNRVTGVKVKITNVSKADISEKKSREKFYSTYSGYPGGLKQESLADLSKRRGLTEVFHRAVKGMLPKNKLAKDRLKNLEISE